MCIITCVGNHLSLSYLALASSSNKLAPVVDTVYIFFPSWHYVLSSTALIRSKHSIFSYTINVFIYISNIICLTVFFYFSAELITEKFDEGILKSTSNKLITNVFETADKFMDELGRQYGKIEEKIERYMHNIQ